jgi:Transglutaminase-like superfamily
MAKLRLLQRKLLTFWGLEPRQRRILLQALAGFPVVIIFLQCMGLKLSQNLLSRLVWAGDLPTDAEIADPEINLILTSTTKMVQTAARYYSPWGKCLSQSLLLWWLLRCQGIIPQLRIGVSKTHANFAAHAWVEYQGHPLGDNLHSQFVAFEGPIRSGNRRKIESLE